jgi:chemotaxis protein methyltransferase CheR
MSLNSVDFELYRDILYKDSGLAISIDKMYLVESRVASVLKKMELGHIDDLTSLLRRNDAKAKHQLIEEMTTNETFFFRDTHPFERFENLVLPKIIESKAPGSTIKIWNAACSSGQEPYSLGIIIKEKAAKFGKNTYDITATDLSTDILDTAKQARYSQFEVQRGMPTTLLIKYFTQCDTDRELKDEIKSMVKFNKFNLLDSMITMPEFDIIFCRNVLIYFDIETKTKIFEELYKKLPKHGFLFLGGAETVIGITDKFKPMPGERGIYVPMDSIYL